MKNTRCTLDRLFDMFRTHGAKTLTMDDIAREFCISKKTLYQKYKNKEELLTEQTVEAGQYRAAFTATVAGGRQNFQFIQ